MHLTRADGLLWLIIAWVDSRFAKGQSRRIRSRYCRWSLLIFGGYLLVMGPWMLRNLSVFSTILSPGGSRALWLVDYNELFSYPSDVLTPARWWAGGWGAIGQPRIVATINNLLSTLLIQGAVVVLPLVLLGLWKLRFDLRVRLGVIAWLMTFGIMTIVFPTPGWRGGFFHSASALQPLLWAVAPVGLEAFVKWWSRWRKLALQPARIFFGAIVILVSFALVVYRVNDQLWGGNFTPTAWSVSNSHHAEIEQVLLALGASKTDIVIVNNPPGYYVANQRSAIVLPNGDANVAYAVAQQFGARYMLLEVNHADALNSLYEQPADVSGWVYLDTLDETHIFEVEP